MDYTDVPRELIYEDRNDIDYFGVGDNSRLEHEFFDKLLERPFMLNRDRVESIKNVPWLVCRIFNNAYYICTLAYLEKYPKMYVDKYKKIASDYNDNSLLWCHRVMPTTMALVHSLLVRSQYKDQKFLDKIKEVFDNWDKDGAPRGKAEFYEQLIYTDEADIDESDKQRFPEFTPRTITYKALGEAFPNTDITQSWRYFTNDYDIDRIAETFDCLGRTVEEKEAMRQSLRWDVDAFCDKDRKPRILAQLDGMDFSSFEHATEQGMEARYGQVVFENNLLCTEIEKMKSKIKESGNTFSPSVIPPEECTSEHNTVNVNASSLAQEVARLKKENEGLKIKLDEGFTWEDTDDISDIEKLEIDERIIFFSSALGVDLSGERISQSRLAMLISKLTPEKPGIRTDDVKVEKKKAESIRTRIVNLNSEEKAVNNKSIDFFSKKTRIAASNVYDYISKVPKDKSAATQRTLDIMENIDVVYDLKKEKKEQET